jgi:Concanavalin A-like lectin/glucanases superfamily
MKHQFPFRLFATAVSAFVLVTSSARADYPSTVLSDAPAGYWRLGEMPVTLADPYQVTNSGSLGAAANGVFAGYVGRQETGALAGSDDKAMRFWGNVAELSRVTFGSGGSFNFTGSGTAMPFTLEVWAKPMSTPSGSQRLISNGSSGQGYGFSLQGNNLLRLTAFGVVDLDSDVYAPTFVSNQWYHLVLVRSNASAYFYVNGAQLGARKTLNNIITTANPLTLGRTASGGEAFTGVLDEPAVYTNTLTLAQIAAHYNAGLNNGAGYAGVILADNPFGYWRLNEPKKVESTSVLANSGSLGTAANGAVFGSLNSVTGGVTGTLVSDANTAMGFAGTDGKINVPYNAGLNTPGYTVECWAKMDAWADAHQSPVTSRDGGGQLLGFILYAAPATDYANAPRWEFWSGTGAAFNTVNAGAADVTLNKWTHLVGTYDAATRLMLLYVDGSLARGLMNVTYAPNLTTPLRIGAGASELNDGQYFWNGEVDEVAVYPAALSPQRVQAHYAAALGGSPSMTSAASILASPLAQTNWAPYPVTLSCVAIGSLPMQLQWFHVSPDGSSTTPVPNATNMTLTLNPTSPTQDGNYYLAATNSLGGAESAWAYVEITPLAAPTFTLNAPATVPVYVGGTAGIPVMAEGTPIITYQWQSNTVNIVGATNSILAVPNVQASYATATYQAKASNVASIATSDPAQLTVLTPPATTYAAQATGLKPLAYWRLGELPPGSLAFDYWGGHPALYVSAYQGSMPGGLLDDDDGAVTLNGTGCYVRTLESTPFNFSGNTNFTLSVFVKANAVVPDNTPARIFSNWQLAPVSSGYGFGLYGMTKLRFTAFGVVDLDANVASLTTDQWYHLAAVRSNNVVYLYIDGQLANSGAVGAIRSSSYPLQLGGNPDAATTESFNGVLDEAAVFNRALTASEIAALYAARYGSLNPPTIVRQPSPERIYVGGTARFAVVATGSQPMGYQWKTNGTAIAGATNASLVVSAVTLAKNNVNYSVTLSNQAGLLTSDNALLTVLQPTGYAAAVVADKPVGLWRLGEPAGPVAYDYWGGYNGDAGTTPVAFGTPGALLNDADTAASFDGAATKIEIPYTAALNPTNFTVEVWAKVTGGQGTYRAVVSARDEGSGFEKGFIIYATDGNAWSFWVGDGSLWQTLTGPAVVLDEWTHLAAVYDGQTKYFYVNGALVGTQTIGYVPNDLRPLRIGTGKNESVPGDYWFNGAIDEVAVYNTVLPAERVQYHYGLGIYGSTTAPFIAQQPVSQTVMVGTQVALNAKAGGSPFLRSQWWKDGVPVPGATNATVAFASAAYADNGIYTLWVTNALGFTNSVAAKLAVMPPPVFALVTNDLVLHLRFENDYKDASGRANNGTAVNSPVFVAGKIGGNALHYNTDTTNGIYNYVTLGAPTDLNFGSNVSFSVSYWVRFTGTPGDLPFLCNALVSWSNPGFTFAPSYNGGGWSWSLGNSVDYVGVYGADNSINDGNWHHLLHAFDRAGADATGVTYLDGMQVDRRSVVAAGDIDTGNSVNIGQDPSGSYQESGTADLDDLGVWRRVLNTYEAQSIYAAGQQSGNSFDTVLPIQLIVQRNGNDIELIWQAGTLQQADTVNGTYTAVAGASAPYYKLTPSSALKFYRIRPVTP